MLNGAQKLTFLLVCVILGSQWLLRAKSGSPWIILKAQKVLLGLKRAHSGSFSSKGPKRPTGALKGLTRSLPGIERG